MKNNYFNNNNVNLNNSNSNNNSGNIPNMKFKTKSQEDRIGRSHLASSQVNSNSSTKNFLEDEDLV